MSDQQQYQGAPQRQIEQMGSIQGDFSEAGVQKPHLVVVASEPSNTPSAPEVKQQDPLREDKIAQTIIDAKLPVIIITEKMAKTYGSLSKYMFDTFPGTPVIFGNRKAETQFNTAPWCDSQRARVNVVGHFTQNAQGQPIANSSSVDVVIVMGSATQAMRETFPKATFFSNKEGQIHDRVNFAAINMLKSKKPQPE